MNVDRRKPVEVVIRRRRTEVAAMRVDADADDRHSLRQVLVDFMYRRYGERPERLGDYEMDVRHPTTGQVFKFASPTTGRNGLPERRTTTDDYRQ